MAVVRRLPRQRSPTPRGYDGDDEAYGEKHQNRSDADQLQEPAHSDVHDLCEFTTWYLINMSGNTAGWLLGGQRSRAGGYTISVCS